MLAVGRYRLVDGKLRPGRYRNNGELIVAARRLGHLHDDWLTLDPTWGQGVFWSVWRPRRLVAADLEPSSPEVDRQDATALPYNDEMFGAVVLDPPYKLNGTDQGEGVRYGVGSYASAADRHDLAYRMMAEAVRVLRPAWKARNDHGEDEWHGGRLLFKCMDQVNGGRMRWQTFMAYEWGAELGLRLVEKLDYPGGRPQPERERWYCTLCKKGNVGRGHACRYVNRHARKAADETGQRPWLRSYPSRQEHAYLRPSSLLIFIKGGPA